MTLSLLYQSPLIHPTCSLKIDLAVAAIHSDQPLERLNQNHLYIRVATSLNLLALVLY
jgi:hypothetical protein